MKTFYSLDYRAYGADRTYTAWFDNLEKAKDFSRHCSHCDNIVTHNFKNILSIQRAESAVSYYKLTHL